MSAATSLQLRDVHLPAAPGWWPLPPGWWLVIGACVLVALLVWAWRARRHRLRRRWQHHFTIALAAAKTPAEEVATMAELLRRAARLRKPGAELLQGAEWLQFLDAPESPAFSCGEGRLLLDGGYRREVDAAAVARLRPLARERFVQLMTGLRT